MRISRFGWIKLVRIAPSQVDQAREKAWTMLVGNDNGTYRYYLTRAGRRATVAALQLRETCIIPALARAA